MLDSKDNKSVDFENKDESMESLNKKEKGTL